MIHLQVIVSTLVFWSVLEKKVKHKTLETNLLYSDLIYRNDKKQKTKKNSSLKIKEDTNFKFA